MKLQINIKKDILSNNQNGIHCAVFLAITGHGFTFYQVGRETGKSYAVMDYFIHEWKTKHKQFTWLRLTEASQKKLLNNNAAQFVDADIARRFDLQLTVKRKSSI